MVKWVKALGVHANRKKIIIRLHQLRSRQHNVKKVYASNCKKGFQNTVQIDFLCNALSASIKSIGEVTGAPPGSLTGLGFWESFFPLTFLFPFLKFIDVFLIVKIFWKVWLSSERMNDRIQGIQEIYTNYRYFFLKKI